MAAGRDDASQFDSLPRTLTRDASATFRAWKLTFPSPDLAVFRSRLAVRVLFGIFLAVGVLLFFVPWLFGFGGAADGDASSDHWMEWFADRSHYIGIGFAWFVGAWFVLFGLAGLAGRFEFWLGPVIFDRRHGVVRKEGRRLKPHSLTDWIARRMRLAPDPELLDGISLGRVAAVQVCTGMTREPKYSDDVPYQTWEINLVLSSPPGQRVYILSHAKEQALRDDARELARFLRVSLLDHAPPGPPPSR